MQQAFSPYLTMGIAVFGVILSLVTLYLTQLRGPKILLTVGPHLQLYYTDYDDGVSTGVYVPATFFNVSARAGVIQKAALELYRKGDDQKRFFMQWRGFSELDPGTNTWKITEMVHALPVLGKSSISKTIWFLWDCVNYEKLTFDEGVYEFALLFWRKPGTKPERESHQLVIDAIGYKKLSTHRDNKRNKTVDFMLDREIEFNKILNPHESARLLGK
jgi:hypothetical protein